VYSRETCEANDKGPGSDLPGENAETNTWLACCVDRFRDEVPCTGPRHLGSALCLP